MGEGGGGEVVLAGAEVVEARGVVVLTGPLDRVVGDGSSSGGVLWSAVGLVVVAGLGLASVSVRARTDPSRSWW